MLDVVKSLHQSHKGDIYQKAMKALQKRLQALDERVQTSKGERAFSNQETLECYGGLAKGICAFLRAGNINFYVKVGTSSPRLLGILLIRNPKDLILLQYIKVPIDKLTVAGYVYMKGEAVNIPHLFDLSIQHSELDPKRMMEIDRRLNRKTREVMAIPIFKKDSREIIAILEVSNTLTKQPFSNAQLSDLQRVSLLFAQSLEMGFMSQLAPLMQNSKQAQLETNTLPTLEDNAAPTLSAQDFINESIRKATEKKLEDEEEKEEEEEKKNHRVEKQKNDQANEKPILKTQRITNAKALFEKLKISKKPEVVDYQPEDDDEEYMNPYDHLCRHKGISQKDFDEAESIAKSEGIPIELLLMTYQTIALQDIGRSLSHYYHTPYSCFDPTIPKPENLLSNVKLDYLKHAHFLPVKLLNEKTIKVLTTDPIALEQNSALQQIFPKMCHKVYVTTHVEFQQTFEHFFGHETEDTNELEDVLSSLAGQYEDGIESTKEETVESGVSDNELVILVNKIISDAYARNVSDIHIEPYPGKAQTLVRFRVDGSLIEYLSLPSTLKDALVARIKVMAEMDIADRRRPQDGKINMKKFSSLKIELRVATIPTAAGLEDAVLRILASGEPLPLEKLGILPENEKKLIPLIEKPYGILFVCGPTGSGKTTTLHSILKHLNTPETKIWTAEDPVEITQTGLRQVQVNRKAGMDFAATMRAFLRADPDIIMVGEMRDHETVSTGVEASLTGHLVMSTLHTNSAPEAVIRLLDMGMDPFNFSDALLGILAQRLAKRLCGDCKVAYKASEEEIRLLAEEYSQELLKTPKWKADKEAEIVQLIDSWKKKYSKSGKITLYKAVGCPSCSSGYKGRMGLHELMVCSDRIKSMIQRKASVEELVGASLEEGMLTLKMDGIHKVIMGVTDIKQVRTVCVK